MINKILYTASRGSHIENFHRHYLNEYRSRGFEVQTVSAGRVGLSSVYKSFDMTFAKNIYSPANILTIFKLAHLIRREQYSVISSHATLSGVITRMAARIAHTNATIIHTCHGYLFCDDNSVKAKFALFLERIFARSTDLLVVMNTEDYAIATKYRLCKNIVFTHGMGVDANKFSNVSLNELDEMRRRIGISEENFVFLCVGEFSSRKNQEMLIKAFAVASKNCNMKLLFAGKGKLLADCQQLAKRLDCNGKIHFLGQVDSLGILYRLSDAVVSTSISEGLPFNIMEALYCGIPVIASKVKGHVDLIRHLKNGALFPINEIQILINYLKLFADNKEFYSTLKACAYLDDKYLLENVQYEVINAYKGVER